MWKNLDPKKKNIVLLGGMLLMLYIAYVFSFLPTLKAMQTHSRLNKAQNASQGSDGMLPQVTKQYNYYSNALKAYHIKADDMENNIWQALSAIAIAKNVEINFNPGPQLPQDSIALKNKIFSRQFNFKGSYFNQVQLLDSLSRTKGIGRIATLRLTVPKEGSSEDNNSKLLLQLTLSALPK